MKWSPLKCAVQCFWDRRNSCQFKLSKVTFHILKSKLSYMYYMTRYFPLGTLPVYTQLNFDFWCLHSCGKVWTASWIFQNNFVHHLMITSSMFSLSLVSLWVSEDYNFFLSFSLFFLMLICCLYIPEDLKIRGGAVPKCFHHRLVETNLKVRGYDRLLWAKSPSLPLPHAKSWKTKYTLMQTGAFIKHVLIQLLLFQAIFKQFLTRIVAKKYELFG